MTEQGREGEAVAPSARPSRLRRWRGIVAAGVVAVAGTLAIVALQQPATEQGRYTVVESEPVAVITPVDPLRTELLRCRALAPGTDDPACRAAWDESRRRFFGEAPAASPRAVSPASIQSGER